MSEQWWLFHYGNPPLVALLCQKGVTLDDDIYLKDEGTHWSNPIGHSYRYRPGQMTFQLLPIVKFVKI